MTTEKVIKRVLEIGSELGLNNYRLSKLMGVSPNSMSVWTRGVRNPSERSLNKVQMFIDKYEEGTLDLPKPKASPTTVKKITNPKVKVMYELIHRIEDKYKTLSEAPDDEPLLTMLRKEAGA